MTAEEYLSYIVNEIHTTVVATVDDNGLPVTAAIDMMDDDGHGLYFLTAKGKGFYDRLMKRRNVRRKPVAIYQSNCLHCGNCYEVCPVGAVEKRK